MKILITGDKGFVGRHFHKALDDEHDIHGVDIKGLTGTDCRTFFRNWDQKWDLVIHLAAVIGGRDQRDSNPLGLATNFSLDSEMFNWALRTGQEKVVYFSSSAAYPAGMQDFGARALRESDIDLDNIVQPDMMYGLAKLVGEVQAKLARERGLDLVVVRPFSGYGADQDLDYPFPSFIDRARRFANPFEIWGNGTATRDFIHMDDVVGAVMTMVNEGIGGPVNLATGRSTSFNGLADLVTKAAGYDPEIKHLHSAPVGSVARVGDPTNMLDFYTPKISLEQGIREALDA